MESIFKLVGLLIEILVYIAILILIIAILVLPIIILIKTIKNIYKKIFNTNKFKYQNNKTTSQTTSWKSNDSYKNATYTPHTESIYPYKKKKLLTQTEYHFYMTLKEECDERNLLICPKVRMEDYIDITTNKEKQKYRGYIKSRHIDFLICDKELNIIAGLELDDNSHNNPKTQKTDELKNNIFKNINIPLMRVNVTSGRYREQIINILNYLVNQK